MFTLRWEVEGILIITRPVPIGKGPSVVGGYNESNEVWLTGPKAADNCLGLFTAQHRPIDLAAIEKREMHDIGAAHRSVEKFGRAGQLEAD